MNRIIEDYKMRAKGNRRDGGNILQEEVNERKVVKHKIVKTLVIADYCYICDAVCHLSVETCSTGRYSAGNRVGHSSGRQLASYYPPLIFIFV